MHISLLSNVAGKCLHPKVARRQISSQKKTVKLREVKGTKKLREEAKLQLHD